MNLRAAILFILIFSKETLCSCKEEEIGEFLQKHTHLERRGSKYPQLKTDPKGVILQCKNTNSFENPPNLFNIYIFCQNDVWKLKYHTVEKDWKRSSYVKITDLLLPEVENNMVACER